MDKHLFADYLLSVYIVFDVHHGARQTAGSGTAALILESKVWSVKIISDAKRKHKAAVQSVFNRNN